MTSNIIAPISAGILAAIWTFMMFLDSLFKLVLSAAAKGRAYSFLREDLFWAGLLARVRFYALLLPLASAQSVFILVRPLEMTSRGSCSQRSALKSSRLMVRS